jgi:hypothetical protein
MSREKRENGNEIYIKDNKELNAGLTDIPNSKDPATAMAVQPTTTATEEEEEEALPPWPSPLPLPTTLTKRGFFSAASCPSRSTGPAMHAMHPRFLPLSPSSLGFVWSCGSEQDQWTTNGCPGGSV